MDLALTHKEGRATLTIKGEIDESGAEVLKNRFREMDRSSIEDIVLNFKDVDYIGSSGVGVLLLIYKDVAPTGGIVRVENVSRDIYDLFLDLEINTIINISKR